MSRPDQELLARAAALSREGHGERVGFFVPGMFVYDGRRGRFPALSLTGDRCSLSCGHCQGLLLAQMTPALDPEGLVETAERAWQGGSLGLLISGGCDSEGKLPWERFAPALARIKERTGLYLAVHAGFVDLAQARALKRAGVDKAMIDVIGHEQTAREVYHLPGLGPVEESLQALAEAGLEMAPHVVAGLHFGRLKGEERAVELALAAGARTLVFVVFMPLKGTPLAGCRPVPPAEAVNLIARTRLGHPEAVLNLGCAKPRGAYRRELDQWALAAGINNIAIPAPEAVDLAPELGLEVVWRETCCAVDIAIGDKDNEQS